MGGAGKTPFAIWLAGKLPAPAFLTRGYRRRSLDPVLVFGPGERASPLQTGDEAQLLLRSGLGPVAVGSDRYRAGIELLKRFQPRVFVLDDGFQHWRLSRGGDLVLIDALDPFPGGAAFPLGRLREEPEALARAKAVVIHRAAEPWPGLERELRRHTSAPVFYSRIVPKSWWRWPPGGTLAPGEMRERKATAFCGLGNPASFWATLAGLGIAPLRRWAFGDHHRYRPRELRQLALQARATGAEVLLTTEKDVQNLPAGAAAMVAPLEIWWLEIGLEVEREAELLALLGPLRESRQ
jgi:tetraacyldisaccharide 4'-kinase